MQVMGKRMFNLLVKNEEEILSNMGIGECIGSRSLRGKYFGFDKGTAAVIRTGCCGSLQEPVSLSLQIEQGL